MDWAAKNKAFVEEFQRRNGLTVDGKAGGATLSALRTVQAPASSESISENDRALIRELERDEGRVLHAYTDSLGFWTIGIGRLIDKRKNGGITNAEADYLKMNDIAKVKRELDATLPWWRGLDPVRQRVIQNLAFNLGTPGLVQKWPNTVEMIRTGNYAGAAEAMRTNRVWIGQVGDRGRRLATMMQTGKAV